jgi:hypothetical protein
MRRVSHPRGSRRRRRATASEDVGLHRDREHGGERGRLRCRARADERPQEREVPRDEREAAEQSRIHTELRVRRLARLERDVAAERRRPRVAEAVALRVAHDALDPVPECVEMAPDRRLVERDRLAGWTPSRRACSRWNSRSACDHVVSGAIDG